MYSWYTACPRTGSYSRLGMSTHTERYVCRKSSGRYGHGIRLNQVNFIEVPSAGYCAGHAVTMRAGAVAESLRNACSTGTIHDVLDVLTPLALPRDLSGRR